MSGDIARVHSLDGSELEAKCFGTPSESISAYSNSDEAITNFIKEVRDAVDVDSDMEKSMVLFLEAAISKDEDCPQELVTMCCTSKDKRTTVHQLIKSHFASTVDSDTVQVDGESHIRLLAKHKKQKGAKRWRQQWPKSVGDFLQFKIIKENVDTMTALANVSKHLRTKSDCIRFAGTKDKRAVTVQWATAFRMRPSNISRLNAFKFGPTVRFGDFTYVSEAIKLGNLRGNRFEIVLRDVKEPASRVEAACLALKNSGFINYFGLQRFGKGGTGSHLIGREVIKGNWKEVVDMMFASREGERDDVTRAKEAFRDGRYEDALQNLPRSMHTEKKVIEGLIRSPRDFLGAYGRIPGNSRLICLHAFQSYVWNVAATHRIQTYGLQCVEGDIVVSSDDVLAEAVDYIDDDTVLETTSEEITGATPNSGHHIVTAEDILKKTYSISDVVLPLLGPDVLFPEHSTGECMRQLLEENGVTSEMLAKTKLRGTYRRVLQRPADFTWRCQQYSDPNEEIQRTELTTLCGDNAASNSGSGSNVAASSEGGDGGGFLAAILEFSLPPGTYATMLLREIMKTSTGTAYHADLTAATYAAVANDGVENSTDVDDKQVHKRQKLDANATADT
mmetsp:Transcript_7628/g.11309  ORF Transcript_7628/g.11309 Transcript_7628/m.11309 type:complete len:619 (-) Transcript_7628:49-1905(-)